MLTYTKQTETDYHNDKSTLYHVFSNGVKVMTTINEDVINYMISKGLLTKES